MLNLQALQGSVTEGKIGQHESNEQFELDKTNAICKAHPDRISCLFRFQWSAELIGFDNGPPPAYRHGKPSETGIHSLRCGDWLCGLLVADADQGPPTGRRQTWPCKPPEAEPLTTLGPRERRYDTQSCTVPVN
ncbi:hypothetical protein N7468_006802 [Penicillium chermesinum]|uniref:Uncharacterized protein n=1 Tax=Penicillium chermesinum TaxID=63820 RepID=A0A9W9NSZ4_9EURO|nr:uncharacterized protein N7468_006802 [Penicillium chermesinum]KAJ5225577.1 hypothetical protein N7468_006802 [Penicillium chermesinum]KAJ6161205.1 hypothetical protein N7470_004601 [Penicillium chermesinum]